MPYTESPKIRQRSRPRRTASTSADLRDPWRGLSADLIDRFIDVQRVENRLPHKGLRHCRADLRALDRWLMQNCRHTSVSAKPDELRLYLWVRVLEGCPEHRLDEVLATMREFYRYIGDVCSRAENPAMELPQRISMPIFSSAAASAAA